MVRSWLKFSGKELVNVYGPGTIIGLCVATATSIIHRLLGDAPVTITFATEDIVAAIVFTTSIFLPGSAIQEHVEQSTRPH